MASGELIAGRYRPLSELGRGATGRVVLAEDTVQPGQRRALKLVGAEQAERLRWEFERLRSLSHPNLGRVHELLTLAGAAGPSGEGGAALVSEYVPGVEALHAVRALGLDQAGRLRLCLDIGRQVARALLAIHSQGLVHGDVKPANILVSEERGAVLLDLGLCRRPGLEATLSGTPGFLAPELFAGDLRFASDLFALGVTLAALFGQEEPRAPLTAVRAGAAELPVLALQESVRHAQASLPNAIPTDVADLVRALVQLDPDARPSSMEEVVERLERLCVLHGGQPSAAGPHSATAAARAQRMLVLPHVGADAERARLSELLEAPGILWVAGPGGSGRSRLVREAVAQLQRRRLSAGQSAPSYQVDGDAPGPLTHDRIWHLQALTAPAIAQLQAAVTAAGLSGHALTVVLETGAVPSVDGAHAELSSLPGVALAPLDEAGLRELLSVALPEARLTGALLEAARAISGGLSGRLCRLLSMGSAAQRELSRPTVLASLVEARADGDASAGNDVLRAIPKRLRPLVETLALLGGNLPGAALLDVSLPVNGALTAGLVTRRADGTLCLRPDLVADVRGGLNPARAELLMATLDRARLPASAVAMVMIVQGETTGALSVMADAIAVERQRGEPERAAQLAAACAAELGEAAVAGVLGQAWIDAERAAGRYREARALSQRLASHQPSLAIPAAEVSRLLGELDEARRWLEAAPEPEAPDARAVLARVCFDAGDLGGAARVAQALLVEARPDGAPGQRALEVLALCDVAGDDADGAVRRLSETLARRGLDAGVQARLWSVIGWAERVRAGSRAALSAYRKAADAADLAGEYHAAASALVNVGNAQLDAGELGPAIWALREGARRLCLLGRDQDVWRALYNLSHARQLAGDIEGAVWMLERASDAAHRCADPDGRCLTESLGAELSLVRGRVAEARTWLEGLDLGEPRPAACRTVLAARAVEVALGLDDNARAKAAMGALEQAAEQGGDASARAELWLSRLRLALAAQKGSDGRAHAQAAAAEAYEAARDVDSFDLRLRAALLSARAAFEAGDNALSNARYGEARLLLDAAARSLPSDQRALLRAAPAYRRALEAAPAIELAGGEREANGDNRLLALGKRLVAERRLSHLYERILDAAIDLTSAQQGYLVIRDREGAARVRAGRGLDRSALPTDAEALSSSIVARVMATGQPLSTTDAAADARLSEASSVHALSLRSVLAVPLLSAGEVRGAIYLEDRIRPHAFGNDEVRVLTDLATLSVAALESAELLRRERRTARRLAVARERLSRQVEAQALELQQLKRGQRDAAGERYGIIGDAAPMRRVLELTERVSRSELPVLVLGESGTGKELLARAIHAQSDRAEGPFVSENCSAIPEALLESALFGHVRGAFTGADRTRQGLFEVADGGTLFLDEVGDMPPAMQVRLLRVLQDGVVRPLGGDRERKVDVRVVAATHRDLEAMVREGTFREDLYYRLAVVSLRLPALRERPSDIGPLVAHFIQRYAPGREVRIDRRALSRLAQYAWPGNVRQLENEVRRALLLADDCVGEEQLSPALLGQQSAPVDELDLKARVDDLERRLIRQAMDEANGNQTRAAKRLGVSRYGLQKMIKRLEI